MNPYLSVHREAAVHALRTLFRQPVAALLILLMLAMAMTLPLALYLGVQSTQQLLGKLKQSPEITLYLAVNADTDDIKTIDSALAQDSRIAHYAFIPKQEGLAQLQQSMGDQDLVSMLDSNPLPDVFTITAKESESAEQVAALQDDLNQLPMIDSVQSDDKWVSTLRHINLFIDRVFLFLAVTLSLAFALVAHNTIRLQILSHRAAIEITKLLGAPASFIRRPFVYLAVWQSLSAAVISLGLCWWLARQTQPLLAAIVQPYGVNLAWRFFTLSEMILVVAVVCGLGIFGAWLATRQHLLRFHEDTH
ncbi:permease-like cell division protein FtsX [Stenoxybacter acetivorans]|uniref:permease-like cell division protein FtsX n=1 Tax=Stenoxybacter acetivorans TaxID=422441 RepID=UPI0009FD5227|nr:permease-like cell division protein FtsX [Stenoxybacter acetivorans]